MIKKILGYLPCWGLFWLGHLISLLLDFGADNDPEPWYWYPTFKVYSWCMRQSAEINDWAGLDVWERLDP